MAVVDCWTGARDTRPFAVLLPCRLWSSFSGQSLRSASSECVVDAGSYTCIDHRAYAYGDANADRYINTCTSSIYRAS